MNTTPWSDTAKIMALTMTSSFIVIILLWMFYPPRTDAGATAVLNTLVGALGGMVSMIVSFYFGSSRSGAAKDNTIASLVTPPPSGPIIEGVVPPPPPKQTPSG